MKAYGRFIARGEIYEGYFTFSSRMLNFDGLEFPVHAVRFLAPVQPSKIVCVGLNYVDHARELKMELPKEPVIFMKPSTSIIGHEDIIELPKQSNRVDYEGELGVVIGKKCRNASREEAYEYIMGYTCFNDVTARDLQQKDGQWTRSKSFDTFAPIGPYVVSISPSNLKIETRLNGKTVQSSTTSNLIFDVAGLVEFISSIMTLKKYDVIATGTPAGVGRLKSGDVVEVEIEKIGILRNYVR